MNRVRTGHLILSHNLALIQSEHSSQRRETGGKGIEFDKRTPKIWQKQAKNSEIKLAINKIVA